MNNCLNVHIERGTHSSVKTEVVFAGVFAMISQFTYRYSKDHHGHSLSIWNEQDDLSIKSHRHPKTKL